MDAEPPSTTARSPSAGERVVERAQHDVEELLVQALRMGSRIRNEYRDQLRSCRPAGAQTPSVVSAWPSAILITMAAWIEANAPQHSPEAKSCLNSTFSPATVASATSRHADTISSALSARAVIGNARSAVSRTRHLEGYTTDLRSCRLSPEDCSASKGRVRSSGGCKVGAARLAVRLQPSLRRNGDIVRGMTTWSEVYDRMTPEQRRVAADICARASDNARQQLDWAEELLALTDMLAQSTGTTAWPAVHLFWVRFHGVVTELVEVNRQPAAWAREMTAQERARSLTMTALEEHEAVVADYLRQRAAHLKQSAYSRRMTKAGNVNETRLIAHLGKAFTVDEIDCMRARVQAQHGSDERFARHVAVKVRPGARRLVKVLRVLHALR